jgi:UPF0755 protein
MRWLAAAGSLITVLVSLAAVGAILSLDVYESPGPLEEPRTVVIERGAGVGKIAADLEAQGVIDSSQMFRVASLIRGDQGSLRAGEYLFPEAISLESVFQYLIEGKTVLRRMTIPEGLTVDAVLALINGMEALQGDIVSVPAEGSVLPDTYYFSLGDDRQAVLDRMTAAMTAELSSAWENRAEDLPLASPHEALVLASIVEKETAVAAERPIVAAVFINRLRKGMKLQADPTVAYGIEKESGPLGRPLTRADLETPTDFNTYVIPGLPPTPIANPGRDAIRAVLNPADSDYLYFVADGSGGHAFARTLREHNRNVAAWRRHRARTKD